MPTALAESINQAYSPPGYLDELNYWWVVKCTATAPIFGVTVGGVPLYASPQDMFLELHSPEAIAHFGPGMCFCANQDGGTDGIFVLGDVWLRSVIATFDVGAAEIRFAAHSYE